MSQIFNLLSENFFRFSFSAILSLFFYRKLGLSQDLSTSMYHVYEGLTLLFTIAGAVLADVWTGLYKSILIMSFVYMFGLVVVSVGLITPLGLPLE